VRKNRVSYGAILRELDKAQREAATSREAVAGDALVKARAQRDELRRFADRVDLTVGVVRLMLEAGVTVDGARVARILDEALDEVCKRTGCVRTPMRDGMTSEALAAAAGAFLGTLDEAETGECSPSTERRLDGASMASPCDDSEHEGEGAA
jgi:hypothetical protein